MDNYYKGYYAQQLQDSAAQQALMQQAGTPQLRAQQAAAQRQAISAQYAVAQQAGAQRAQWDVPQTPVGFGFPPAQYPPAPERRLGTPYPSEVKLGDRVSDSELDASEKRMMSLCFRGFLLMCIVVFLLVLVVIIFTSLDAIKKKNYNAEHGPNKVVKAAGAADYDDYDNPKNSEAARAKYYQRPMFATRRATQAPKAEVDLRSREGRVLVAEVSKVGLMH